MEAYARYTYSQDRAPLRSAQKLHDQFRNIQLSLASKYPQYDFVSERFLNEIRNAAAAWWNSRAFRGAGVDW